MNKLDEYLASPDPRHRFQAVQFIAQSPSAEGVAQLVGRVREEPHPKIRAAMVQAIGQIAPLDHIALLAKLTGDDAPLVRIRAVDSLGKTGHAHVYPTLVRVIGRETEAKIRDIAAHYVLRLGPENVLKLLRKMVQSEKLWQQESAVLTSQLFASPHVVPILKHAYDSGAEKLQELALEGLRKVAEQGVAEARTLVETLEAANAPQEEETPLLDLAALEAMGPISDDAEFNTTYTGRLLPRVEIEPEELSAGGEGGLFSADAPSVREPEHAMASGDAFAGSNSFPAPVTSATDSPGVSALPGASSGLPGGGSALPGASSGLPGAGSGQPGGGSALPGTGSGLPAGGSALPGAGSPALPGSGSPFAAASAAGGAPESGDSPGMDAGPGSGLPGGGGLARGRGRPGGSSGSAAQTRPCPVCGEEIAVKAKKCRFCHEVFDREGLKQMRQSQRSGGGSGDMPRELSLITGLNILGGTLGLLGAMVAMGSEEPGRIVAGLIDGAISGLLLFAAVKTRRRSFSGLTLLIRLTKLNGLLSMLTLNVIRVLILWYIHGVLTRQDAVDYCSEE